jgi:pimeloyl-ACP methyl ester carboxylesterase
MNIEAEDPTEPGGRPDAVDPDPDPDPGLRPVRPPDQWLQWAESRMWFELSAFLAASPLLRSVGRGDRHPVLVLPGFSGDDHSTVPLRLVLRAQGYWTHGWGLGPNLGPTDRVLDGIEHRLDHLWNRHGRKVSLVGWSLGGVYARELARDHPHAVRQVITLGSPFRMREGDQSSVSHLADGLSSQWRADALRAAWAEQDKPPLPVPSTAIYSRTDGVVRWHICIDEESDQHENVEVFGSHSGLGFNPAAVYVVSDRLAQPEGDWRRFSAPPALRLLFPRPASWRQAAA